MTTEEKAKAYDEAIERAKSKIKNEKDHVLYEKDITDIFPALEESEDERIRKEIIDIIDSYDVAHLKASGLPSRIPKYIAWLEKQGEQKETLCDKCRKEQPSHSCQDIAELGRCAIEHEQKPTNEIEPKFHESEWITNGDYTWKIVEVKPLDYILQSQDGNIVDDTISHVEEQFHSFTIEDARDGDVIYSRHNTESFEWIGIYKSLDKENKRVFFYGFWHDMAKTFSVCGNEAYVLYDDFSPATKEQRDTLEKAMADAGWEFDFDKKELKKIEEEVNGEDYGIDSLYHAQRILEKTLGKVDGYQTDDGILSHQCAITAVKKLYEQKPAWSEEDDNCLSTIIAEFSKCSGKSVSKDEWMRCNDFLNSLKDRCTWKPSEEQMDALDYYANSLCTYCDRQDDLRSLLHDLKKL